MGQQEGTNRHIQYVRIPPPVQLLQASTILHCVVGIVGFLQEVADQILLGESAQCVGKEPLTDQERIQKFRFHLLELSCEGARS